jgi:hypothetical protein
MRERKEEEKGARRERREEENKSITPDMADLGNREVNAKLLNTQALQ